MIAVDTNILIYAHRKDSPFFAIADKKLTALAESGKIWGIPWPCIHEFLAVATHPRIFNPPSTMPEALAQAEAWMECPQLNLLGEPPGYWDSIKKMIVKGKIVGPMIHDARVAAICVQSGVSVLWSTDRDFSRMEGIDILNPLI